MRVKLSTRDEAGKPHTLIQADFEPDEFERLERDYQSFLAIESPLSGTYNCRESHLNPMKDGVERRITVLFGEILGLY